MQVLSRQPLWNALLSHFKEAGCLVEGPLSNLKQSPMQLAKPRKASSLLNDCPVNPCLVLAHIMSFGALSTVMLLLAPC